MKLKLKIVWCIMNIFRGLPAILVYLLDSNKNIIDADIDRWVTCYSLEELSFPNWLYLNWLLLYFKEYRNLFYHRVKNKKYLIGFLYPREKTLFIYTQEIGGGLFIQHGFSTVISASRIGRNCWINQQVTIGFSNKSDCPTIEDNVTIASGAKVIGNVTIGKNSIVGANSVVVKNIPSNSTVVGNPAVIVKRDGVRVKEYLHSF